eukprot:CAMPEP_0119465538 /NCGR_PEP_ID=MMETSP1344-20130328/622_1 /TAXON_ID=236787 /ORGANISM="Florenciella parvula, Strain CCMP2471" /LENGTH=91 /DNA_ID=CAMNT_0007497805 /DNA_START=110 /DNA_END=385 /DNA_ORIENTATION=-
MEHRESLALGPTLACLDHAQGAGLLSHGFRRLVPRTALAAAALEVEHEAVVSLNFAVGLVNDDTAIFMERHLKRPSLHIGQFGDDDGLVCE